MAGFISVCDWRRFQHYDPSKRQPPWIKLYTELLSNDDYLGLTLRLRGILAGIWLAYAESRSKLGANPVKLGRLIGDDSVRTRDLNSLNRAGFIDIVASAELAEGYHDARPHARPRARPETEKEKTKGLNGSRPERKSPDFQIPEELLRDVT